LNPVPEFFAIENYWCEARPGNRGCDSLAGGAKLKTKNLRFEISDLRFEI
jgi:hypothetical protein